MRLLRAALLSALLAPAIAPAQQPAGDEPKDPSETPADAAPGPSRAKFAAYVEIGGPGGLYSINAEAWLASRIAFRAGAGVLSDTRTVLALSFLPLRSGSHALEVGAGAVSIRPSVEGLHTMGTASIGYRYAPVAGGFNFRAALTPLFYSSSVIGRGGVDFLPWAGLSFGYAL